MCNAHGSPHRGTMREGSFAHHDEGTLRNLFAHRRIGVRARERGRPSNATGSRSRSADSIRFGGGRGPSERA